ncbi:MAG: helix-turn-helix transcriptional regulator [Clostridiales bacterium]|nr:helix-turn-helix transcriptional regulator [Clostridiales bacterium]
MDFGKHFRQCRKDAKLSQKYVADKLGIHQSNVSDWENNVSRPEYEKLIELAKIYNATLYELLGLDEREFFR